MSLLHKALKKAEREGGASSGPGALVDSEESPKSPSIRLYILIGLVITLLPIAVLFHFSKKQAPLAPGAPVTKTSSHPAQYSEDGKQKLEAGKLEEARGLFEKAVLLEPRSAEAYNNLGLVLKKLGRNEEAFEQYRKSLSIDPQCAECLNNMGVLYLANRDLAEAEPHLQMAIQVKPDYAEPYFHLALLLEARGDLAQAKKNYLKFVELAKGISADFLLKVQKRIAVLETP